jgi:type I restriction enzyme S subunit
MAKLPITWSRVPIVDLCEAHVDCVNRTAPVVNEPTPFKMIRTTNVRNGFIDSENVRFVTEATYKRWTRRLVPKRGDIILTREAPLGDVGKIRTDDLVFLGQRLYQFRPDPQKLDADFLLYSLLGNDLQGQIHGFGSGSTVEHMRLEDIPSLEINLPPLPVQRCIAGILSAYDELMENSQRRIRILESMARVLYREWFVHFCFPGHEKLPRVASALGDIPQGWEVKLVKDVLARRAAGTVYREADVKQEGAIPVLDQSTSELLGFHNNEADHFASPESPLAIFGDHTCKMQLLIEPFSVGPNVVPFAANAELPMAYVFYAVNNLVQTQEYKRHWSPLNAKEILVADHATAKRFATHIQPMLVGQEILRKAILNLHRTRDLLLPRLVSGQVEVEAA